MDEQKPDSGEQAKKVISIAIKDKSVLYATYMPFLKRGGLFIPTNKTYKMGEKVAFLMTLMDDKEKYPIDGTVVWVTPKGAQGYRVPGIGVHFEDHNCKMLRSRIETYVAGLANSSNPTHTL